MTPIRNITDRERDLTAERDEYKAHAQQLMTTLLERTAERDAFKARLLPYESRTYKTIDESALILETGKYHKWEDEDGVDWEWFSRDIECDSCIDVALVRADKLNELILAAGAQGHTREQIGLAQDDRREGLDAHHVYCRTVTEDV